MAKPKDASVFIDGIEVGVTEVWSQTPRPALPPSIGPITVHMTFRPNWVGIWKLAAAVADRDFD